MNYVLIISTFFLGIAINQFIKHFFMKNETQAMICLFLEMAFCFFLAMSFYFLVVGSMDFRCMIGFIIGIIVTFPSIKKINQDKADK